MKKKVELDYSGEQLRVEKDYTMCSCLTCHKAFRFRNIVDVPEAIAFCSERCREKYFQKNHVRAMRRLDLKPDGRPLTC